MIQHVSLLLTIISAVDVRKFINEINELVSGATLNPNDILDVSVNGYVAISDIPLSASSDTRRAWYEAMDQGTFQKTFSSYFGKNVTALFSSDIGELSSPSLNLTVSIRSLDIPEIEKRANKGTFYASASKYVTCSPSFQGSREFTGHCTNFPIPRALSVSYHNNDDFSQHVSLYSKRYCYHRVIHAWVDANEEHCFQADELSSIWTDGPGGNAPER